MKEIKLSDLNIGNKFKLYDGQKEWYYYRGQTHEVCKISVEPNSYGTIDISCDTLVLIEA